MNPNHKPPPKLPNQFEVPLFHVATFTWKQRLQILIGYVVGIKTVVRIDKRDGRVWENQSIAVFDPRDPKNQPKPSNITE